MFSYSEDSVLLGCKYEISYHTNGASGFSTPEISYSPLEWESAQRMTRAGIIENLVSRLSNMIDQYKTIQILKQVSL